MKLSNKRFKLPLLSYNLTFAAIVVLFFMWGVAMNLMNSLNTSVAYYLQVDDMGASFMQLFYYFAYLVAAIPAALVTQKYGYKGGIVSALALFVTGCLLTVPATNVARDNSWVGFTIFLVALFVMSSGSAALEANCNSLVTRLGSENDEATRMNFANAFNGLGSMAGPFILSVFVGAVSMDNSAGENLTLQFLEDKLQFLNSLQFIYLLMAFVLFLLFLLFLLVRLPNVAQTSPKVNASKASAQGKSSKQTSRFLAHFKAPFAYKHYRLGMIALFCYTGIQLSGMTLVAWFAQEEAGLTLATATFLVSVSSIVLTAGRFISVPFMHKCSPNKVLGVYMVCAAACFGGATVLSLAGHGFAGLCSFVAAFFFCSVGYGTVYSLALHGLKGSTVKMGGSLLVMAMIGGGIFTVVFSAIANALCNANYPGYAWVVLGYIVPLLFIAWYGFKGSKVELAPGAEVEETL